MQDGTNGYPIRTGEPPERRRPGYRCKFPLLDLRVGEYIEVGPADLKQASNRAYQFGAHYGVRFRQEKVSDTLWRIWRVKA